MTYFNKPSDLAPVTKARSVDINNLAALIAAAFGKLPDELDLKMGTVNYAVNTGPNGAAYSVVMATAIKAYADGLEVKMRPVKDNTGACTLNVNGLGNIAIKRADGTDPQAGDILGNTPITLTYQAAGNLFRLPAVVNSQIIQAAGSSAQAQASAAAAAASAAIALKTLAWEAVDPPADPLEGQEWIDAATGRRFTFIEGQWAETYASQVVDQPTLVDALSSALQLADYAAVRAYAGSRKSVYVTGYLGASAPSGIAGMFVRDDHDTTTADNGGTVIVSAAGVRWKRANIDGVCPDWFGAKGDGITNDTAAVIAALASGRTVVARAGETYKLSDGITVDIGKQGFIGQGAALDFSALSGTSKTAITMVNTNSGFANDLNVPFAHRHVISGFVILGPGKAGGGASFTGDTTVAVSNNTAHGAIRDCLIYGFGTGLKVSTEGYIQTYNHIGIGQCAVGISIPAGGSNYGERIALTNCTIYDNALAISNYCQTGAIQLIGCSLDYNVKTLDAGNSSVTELISCWWECNDAGAGKVVASLAGASSLVMTAGRVQQNGTPGALAQSGFLNTSSDSVATFRDVFMFNTKNVANVFDSGSGLCELEGIKSYAVSYITSRISAVANNRMADGGFESAAIQDLFSIVDDTAAITNRLTGSNLTLSLTSSQAHSGTKSLKFQKTAGGAAGSFVLVVPAKPGARVTATLWYRKEAAALSSATVFVQTQAVRLLGLKSNGVPDFTNSAVLDTFGIGGTDALIDWTKLETSMDRRLPSWANAFLIYFNATSFQGTFEFDDFNISTM